MKTANSNRKPSSSHPAYLSESQKDYLESIILPRLAAEFPRPAAAPAPLSSAFHRDARPLPPDSVIGDDSGSRAPGRSPSEPLRGAARAVCVPTAVSRCSHTTRDGRRCRSRSTHPDSIYCPIHERLARRNPDSAAVCPLCHRPTSGPDPLLPNLAKELLGPIEDFQTAASINHALGRLVLLQARNRIPPRNAAVLAYTFQLLLQSLSETKKEVWHARKFPDSEQEIAQVVESLPPLTDLPAERVGRK